MHGRIDRVNLFSLTGGDKIDAPDIAFIGITIEEDCVEVVIMYFCSLE